MAPAPESETEEEAAERKAEFERLRAEYEEEQQQREEERKRQFEREQAKYEAGQSHTKVACTFLVTFVWVVFRRMVAGGFLDVPQRDIGSVFRVLGGSGRPA
jgi:hypothetical protein